MKRNPETQKSRKRSTPAGQEGEKGWAFPNEEVDSSPGAGGRGERGGGGGPRPVPDGGHRSAGGVDELERRRASSPG